MISTFNQASETYVYDTRDRLVTHTDRINATTAYTYDANSNTTTITDAEGSVTTYEYDPRNLETLTIYPNDGDQPGGTDPAGADRVAMAYDGLSRPRVKTDQLGDTCTYIYDLAGRLLEKQYAAGPGSPNLADDGKNDVFTYDDASRLLTATSQRYDNAVTYTWTDDGLIASEALTVPASGGGQTYTVQRGYDAADRLTSITYPDGRVVTRSYFDDDTLDAVTFAGNPIVDRTYDPANRLTSTQYGNGLTETRTYNRQDHLITRIHTPAPGNGGGGNPGAGVTDFSYTYDENKNLTAENDAALPDYAFTTGHDAADRLIDWDRSNGESQLWNLTLVGDWDTFSGDELDGGGVLTPFTENRDHNPVHEIESINATALQHDPKGNLTQDATPGGGKTYAYDFDNQLKSATVPAGASGVEGTHTYTYDALGRRVSKTVNPASGGTSGGMIIFVCHTQQAPAGTGSVPAGQVLAEYTLGSTPASPAQSYVWGSYIDEALYVETLTASHFLHSNRQYSIAAATDATTAAVEERYTYTPYGQQTLLDATGIPRTTTTIYNTFQTLGHQGLVHDEESALIYNRARMRSPELGRFIQRDPLGYVDEFTLYASHQSMTQSLDPSGRQGCIGRGSAARVMKVLFRKRTSNFRVRVNNPSTPIRDYAFEVFTGQSPTHHYFDKYVCECEVKCTLCSKRGRRRVWNKYIWEEVDSDKFYKSHLHKMALLGNVAVSVSNSLNSDAPLPSMPLPDDHAKAKGQHADKFREKRSKLIEKFMDNCAILCLEGVHIAKE